MTAAARVSVGTKRETRRPFNTFAEQLLAVRRAAFGDVDPRLRLLATATGMGENIPADGGFGVQLDFSSAIIQRAFQTGQILRRVRRKPVGPNANGIKLNAFDETSRVDGQRLGGARALWANEGDAATAVKPKMRQLELNLHKLIALWYESNELDGDSETFSNDLVEGFSTEVQYVTEDAIVNGTGSGQLLGILKSPALITVAAEGGQTATTFVGLNAVKMFARLYANPDPSSVVWLVNADVLPQLFTLTLATGTAIVPIYDGDATPDAPYGTLLCRPVIPFEACATLGAVGDVILTDLSQYVLAEKPMQVVRSMHVRFITDEMAFRITYRIDGQGIWYKALTPKNGTTTVSPYVNLAAR